MCPPVLALAAGGIGAVGALQAASATAAADKANAAQSRAQAQATADKTTSEVDQADRKYQKVLGSTLNIIGASGIAPSSFAAVIDDDSKEAELEKANIRWNGDAQRTQLANKARASDAEAKNAKTAGYINAAGSLVGGASNFAKLSSPANTPFDNTLSGGVSFSTAFA